MAFLPPSPPHRSYLPCYRGRSHRSRQSLLVACGTPPKNEITLQVVSPLGSPLPTAVRKGFCKLRAFPPAPAKPSTFQLIGASPPATRSTELLPTLDPH